MVDLIQKTEGFIFNLFKDKLSSEYTYHNFLHTQFVVSKLKELISAENCSEEDTFNLILAGWFHDSGYTCCNGGHEEESAEIAETFLTENGVDNAAIQKIKKLILATKINHQPENQLERMIKDADTAHVGDKLFDKISTQLRNEWEVGEKKDITDAEWNKMNYEFLTHTHRFYTPYALKNWQPIKLENTIRVLETIRNKDEIKAKAKARKQKLAKLERPERGVETLYRVTLNNHTRLSDIADSKANILLSVNAIIISIALSTLLPKLASPKNEYLIFPTLTMLLVSVLCIVFAIMATKPNISKIIFTAADIQSRKVNLLFFGNFHKMELDQYTAAMRELISDRTYLYDSLTRDLYYLGLVLERKYRLLRITYYIFMVGIILTVFVFILAFYQNSGFNLFED